MRIMVRVMGLIVLRKRGLKVNLTMTVLNVAKCLTSDMQVVQVEEEVALFLSRVEEQYMLVQMLSLDVVLAMELVEVLM